MLLECFLKEKVVFESDLASGVWRNKEKEKKRGSESCH